MPGAPIPPDEEARLDALARTRILDTAPEERFERLTRLAARLLGTPVAMASLVDRDRQWIKSAVGTDLREIPRRAAFCAHGILTDAPLVVEDATRDARFADSPLVIGAPHFRAYLGFPLASVEGRRLGMLGVLDHAPRHFPPEQIEILRDLAALAERELNLERDIAARIGDIGRLNGQLSAALRHADERRAEADAAAREARTAGEAQRRFLASLGRDLFAPLGEMLASAQAADDGGAAPGLTRAASARRLLGLIEDVIDYTALLDHDVRLEPTGFDLRTLVEETLDLFAPRARARGIDLLSHLAPGRDTGIVSDPVRIRQILDHLLENAIGLTDAGHVLVRLEAHPASDGRLAFDILVEDTGPGMAPEEVPRLLRPYTRGEAAIRRGHGGAGLGLSICAALAERLGGSLRLDARPGGGTVAGLRIQGPADPLAAAPPAQMPAECRRRLTLVLDARAEVAGDLALTLASLGLQTRVAVDPEQVLEQLEALPEDAAVLVDPGSFLGDPAKALCLAAQRRAMVFLCRDPGDLAPGLHTGPHRACVTRPAHAARLAAALQAVWSPGAGLGGAVAAQQARAAPSPYPVLVVDDNSVNRKVVGGMLRGLGFAPAFAENGRIAVELARRQAFGLVLMDLEMPVMDGIAATEAIRATLPTSLQPRIYGLTAFDTPEYRAACARVGMDGFLTKPILTSTLEEILGRCTAPFSSERTPRQGHRPR